MVYPLHCLVLPITLTPTCHDAGLHVAHVRLLLPGGGQDVHEHGGGAVDGGAPLSLYRIHARSAVKAKDNSDKQYRYYLL